MDIAALIDETRSQLRTIVTRSKQLADSVRAAAFLSDNADKLENQTLAQVRTALDAPLAAHNAQANPHNETAASVGIPLKTAVDAKLAQLIPTGILPFSNYGSQDYLPPNVAGSFEGGTTAASPKITALLVENDGTLVFLRNGTNGSKSGVFYAYVKNALTIPQLVNPIKTNKKYAPSYFPAGKSAAQLLAWSEQLLYGRLQDDATGALGDYFLSVTNGTFDDSKHVGTIIPAANGSAVFDGGLCILGSTIYHFSANIPAWTTPVDIEVRTIPLAGVLAGTAATWTKVDTWSTTGFSGSVSSTNIRLANVVASPNLADKPLLQVTGPTAFTALNLSHYEYPSLYAVPDEASGKIRLKWSANTYAATSLGSLYRYITFSFVVTPAGKAAALDSGLTTQNQISFNDAVVNMTGPVYATPQEYDAINSPSNSRRDIHYSDAGYVFSIRVHQSIDTVDLLRTKITNYSTRYEAARYGATVGQDITGINSVATYGTAIGGAMVGCYPVALNKAVINCLGRNNAGSTVRGQAWSALEGTSNDYTYRSILNGSYKGYRPSADRGFVNDLGKDDSYLNMPVVEVIGQTIVVSGNNYIRADITGASRPTRINADLSVGSGQITVSDAMLDSIAQKYWATQSVANITQRHAQLVIPQQSGVPPFAIIHGYTSDRTTWIAACRVTLTIVNSVVTAVAVSEPMAAYQIMSTGTGLDVTSQYIGLLGAVTLYDAGTAVLIGIPSPIGHSYIGASPRSLMRLKYVKSTGKFSYPSGLGMVHATPLASDANAFFAHPSLGFGIQTGSITPTGENDYFTKCVFAPFATTEAEFDTWQPKAKANWRVIVSQDVAEGWILYFTDPQPAFLAGQAYTLSPVNVNLLDITASPANKTFYVYVKLEAGVAKYVVRETELAESETVIYIGYVTTGISNITLVAVDKAYRIGTYRVSSQPVGSAIPVSSGNPADAVKLTWT